MATQITNQANLTFNYGTATGSVTSNVATTTLLAPLSVEKTSVGNTYRADDKITYVLSVQNNGNTTISGITVSDDLGTYVLDEESLTPLVHTGEASLYVNGVYVSAIIGAMEENRVIFTLPALAPGANALVVYLAEVNEYAPLTAGSVIENTVTVTSASIPGALTATNIITVEDYADISIRKEMSPDAVSDGDVLTYTFTVRNDGNTDATGVVLTDIFNPAPDAISVVVDGQTVAVTNYSYVDGFLTLPVGDDFSMTVPAATIERNPNTGEITRIPGVLVITVSGMI